MIEEIKKLKEENRCLKNWKGRYYRELILRRSKESKYKEVTKIIIDNEIYLCLKIGEINGK